MDIDGTLTDGTIYMGHNRELFKAFNSKDGYGICDILPRFQCIPVVITARQSDIVRKRCAELGISEVYQGCKDKKHVMLEIAQKYGIYIDSRGRLPHTAYIGDDIPDLSCMELAEHRGCPADAVMEIIRISDFVSVHNGGHGAVREFIEWLFEK